MKQRILATFMCLCLVLGLMPTVALAEEKEIANGTSGGIDWKVENNVLTISVADTPDSGYNSGDMPDYARAANQENSVPWYSYLGTISEVILNEGVKNIGDSAFYKAKLLTSITYQGYTDVPLELGIAAIGGCSSLTSITGLDCHRDEETGLIFEGLNEKEKVIGFSGTDEFVKIPDSVTTIGLSAFNGCTTLESINLGKVQVIEDNAFNSCSNLTTITFPNTLRTIGDWAFGGGTGLTVLALPEGVVSIGIGAFGHSNLKEVILPNSIESIGNECFAYSNDLEKVTLPGNLQTVGRSMFHGCKALKSIKIPEGITTIEQNAFHSCLALEYVWLPTSLKSIGNSAFFGCKALNHINIPSGVDTFGTAVFNESGTYNSPLVIYIDSKAYIGNLPTIENDTMKVSKAVTNGGTFVEDTTFTAGTLATPTKDGAIFAGWYDNEQCSGTVVDSPTVGQTYYAKWTESTYSVTERPLVFGSVTYGATVEAKTITVAGLDDSVTLTAVSSDEGIFTATASGSEVTVAPKVNLDVGTYNEVITITTPDDATFFVDVSITIEQAPTSIGITAKPTSLTGGGTVTLTVTKTGLPQDAQVSVSGYSNITDNGDGTYTVALPNSTATYTFTASYAGDANHKDATANCTVFVTQYTGGGSSSSGSSSVSGSGDNVIITASSGTVTDAQMESAVKKANKGSTITIKATSSTTVTLPVGGMADAADNNNDVLLDLRYGEVTLSARAIAGMTDGVSSNDKIKVSVTSQTNSKDETISDLLDKGGAVFDVSVEVDGVEIHSFDGTLTITLTVSNLSKISDPHVLHILTDGTKEYYAPDRISGNTITVKGVRNLSTFAVIPGSEVPQTNPFTDVTTSDYYYDAVLWAVANGVTNGSSATTFSPNVAVSRAQMVTFLWRAHGSPEATGTNPFTDVSTSDYYYDAVLWAVANGVTNGTSATTFSPDAPVTRAQAVTFQWRAAGSPVVSGSSFGDVTADAYYVNAVTWAVANGITNGTSGTTFSPDVVVSRAQAVTFLYREQE